MYAQLRKHLRPGQEIVECGIAMRDDREFLRTRLRRLLSGEPRPAALIGVCIRPEPELVAEFRGAGVPVISSSCSRRCWSGARRPEGRPRRKRRVAPGRRG